ERNLIRDGFLAKSMDEELPGDPNLRVYVTEEIRDVTKQIRAKIKPGSGGIALYDVIDKAEKALVVACEKPGNLRCDVASFYGGASYQLIRQREIKDVRLVYAPPDSIGKFGGDVDNWIWPRHTGDFSFLRAYVGKDGKSATYSKDNVPFKPKYHLPVQADGVAPGDFVMVVGYPGRTSRYRLAEEMEGAIDWSYPNSIRNNTDVLAIINAAGKNNPGIAVKYASAVASYNNGLKNYEGQLEGLARAQALKQKQAQAIALQGWLASSDDASLNDDVAALRTLISEQAKTRERDHVLGQLARTNLYSAAYSLDRLAIERAKSDSDRESGFQKRDEIRVQGRLKEMDRRGDPAVDARLMSYFLKHFMKLPTDQHVASIDAWLGGATVSDAAVDAKVAALYAGTKLMSLDERLKWFDADRKAIEASDDAALAWMVALMPDLLRIENEKKASSGDELRLRPRYMDAMIAWKRSQGQAVYPDANSSLRVTFGQVQGLKKDGMEYYPFTTLRGITGKYTGVDPFDSPKSQLDAIAAKDYGSYKVDSLDSVPVDFLADLDITGGNSGSPTIDANGGLVGLAFDGIWESVSADWIFNPGLTRSIQVDVRYMLWIMDRIDHADNLLTEMGVK
ncbi:MAG: S46 family peptidase, partial [Dokdonella sp.]